MVWIFAESVFIDIISTSIYKRFYSWILMMFILRIPFNKLGFCMRLKQFTEWLHVLKILSSGIDLIFAVKKKI